MAETDPDLAAAELDIREGLAAVTPEQWAMLWAAVDKAGLSNPDADRGGHEHYDGNEASLSTPVGQLIVLITELGLIVPLRALPWRDLQRYYEGVLLSDGSVVDAVWILTAIVRRDRLVPGSIDEGLRDGMVGAALERILAWSTS